MPALNEKPNKTRKSCWCFGDVGEGESALVPGQHCHWEIPCSARWLSLSQLPLHKMKKVLDSQRPNSSIWAKSSKEHMWTMAVCRRQQSKQLPCSLSNPPRTPLSSASSLNNERLFHSLSLSILCPKRRHFITSDIFLTNLQKAYLIFFLTMPCYLCLF